MENHEEEKITTKPRAQRKGRPTKSIVDDRTESRKKFLEINNTDPRLRLSNIPQSQAKERRQKIINETRQKRGEEDETKDIIQQVKEVKDLKQLSAIVIALAETIKMFSQTSQLEIENIRKEVNIKLSVIEKYNKTLLQMEERVDLKIKRSKHENTKLHQYSEVTEAHRRFQTPTQQKEKMGTKRCLHT